MRLLIVGLLLQALAGADPAQMEKAADLGYRPVPIALSLPNGWTLGAPSSVAIDARDHLLVFNRGVHPIVEFDRDGTFVRTIGEGTYTRPHGMRLDRDGNIWVVDDRGHSVTKLSARGDVLLRLGSEVLEQPTDVAIAPTGDIFVTQGHGQSVPRVLRFDRTGRLITAWGGLGTAPGRFDVAHSIVIDGDGLVYVADRQNRRVQIFDVNGTFIKEWKFAGLPCGLYIGAGGEMYLVTGFAGQILKLDQDGRVIAATGQPGKGLGEFGEAHFMAIASDRSIYVADTVNAALHKFVRK
jgi:DNA-binding beta-propeller fold protein YncE